MITVGDQIFALNQEVKQLKQQCQRYEAALRDIANDGSSAPSAPSNPACRAKQALGEEVSAHGPGGS